MISNMEIRKANWTTDGDRISMQMELTKVDKENRLVSGWASLDNPDLQDDLVLAEASQNAFSRFRGNIREMHQPKAVGKMVSYSPEKFYDANTGQWYNGIYVTAYISKGAQDTWEKVLDGTLSAFSIKGPIRKADQQFSKDLNRPLRVVYDYDLDELSLVVSGGNQLANVVTITKSVDGDVTLTGMAAEVTIENVYWCDIDKIAKTSTEEAMECPEGHKMENIGWFEYDGGSELEKLQTVIKNYLEKDDTKEQTSESVENEGGVDVAEKKETVETKPDAGVAAPSVQDPAEQGKAESEVNASESAADVEEVAADDKKEEAASVSEVEADADLQKSLEELKTRLEDGVVQNENAIAEVIKSLDDKFETLQKSLTEKISELEQKHSELSKSVESAMEGLEKINTSVEGLENSTAVKKSGDLGGSAGEGTLEKSGSSVWAGTIL